MAADLQHHRHPQLLIRGQQRGGGSREERSPAAAKELKIGSRWEKYKTSVHYSEQHFISLALEIMISLDLGKLKLLLSNNVHYPVRQTPAVPIILCKMTML